eukprot:5338109-Amphidinium_carterae.1
MQRACTAISDTFTVHACCTLCSTPGVPRQRSPCLRTGWHPLLHATSMHRHIRYIHGSCMLHALQHPGTASTEVPLLAHPVFAH